MRWVVLLLASSGCSLMLDWSVDRLPCSNDGECLENYSCLGRECIPDESVEQGKTCNLSKQCSGGDMVCSPVGQELVRFTCRKRCSAYFQFTNDCASGEYCAPFPDENDESDFDGACLPTECEETDECDGGEVCVPIHSSASACLPGCAITWNGTEYRDNCGGTTNEPKSCQPIGNLQQGEILVCLDSKSGGKHEGDSCHPITDVCRPRTEAPPITGMACVDGFCKRHCDEDAAGQPQCIGTQICQLHNKLDRFGICE